MDVPSFVSYDTHIECMLQETIRYSKQLETEVQRCNATLRAVALELAAGEARDAGIDRLTRALAQYNNNDAMIDRDLLLGKIQELEDSNRQLRQEVDVCRYALGALQRQAPLVPSLRRRRSLDEIPRDVRPADLLSPFDRYQRALAEALEKYARLERAVRELAVEHGPLPAPDYALFEDVHAVKRERDEQAGKLRLLEGRVATAAKFLRDALLETPSQDLHHHRLKCVLAYLTGDVAPQLQLPVPVLDPDLSLHLPATTVDVSSTTSTKKRDRLFSTIELIKERCADMIQKLEDVDHIEMMSRYKREEKPEEDRPDSSRDRLKQLVQPQDREKIFKQSIHRSYNISYMMKGKDILDKYANKD